MNHSIEFEIGHRFLKIKILFRICNPYIHLFPQIIVALNLWIDKYEFQSSNCTHLPTLTRHYRFISIWILDRIKQIDFVNQPWVCSRNLMSLNILFFVLQTNLKVGCNLHTKVLKPVNLSSQPVNSTETQKRTKVKIHHIHIKQFRKF